MQKYKVLFHADAQTEIVSSYEWGCRVWGRERANQWIRQLRHTIRSRLASLPLSCPIAPESEEVGVEIRQLIMRRYRIRTAFTFDRHFRLAGFQVIGLK